MPEPCHQLAAVQAVGSGVGVGIAAGAPELPTATEAGRLLNAPHTMLPADLIRT